ncbi:hypothetical protein VTJ04DRAFT_7655 [Mycothermus thermophilus]|uniref:uncharacterized protein n=1 Tax=Humicola insolens TaxID=85995 RepID=UPI0037446BE3
MVYDGTMTFGVSLSWLFCSRDLRFQLFAPLPAYIFSGYFAMILTAQKVSSPLVHSYNQAMQTSLPFGSVTTN